MRNKMKAATAGITAAVIIAACSFTCLADASQWKYGDCNDDGAVNISDLVALGNHINKRGAYDFRKDLNGDGVINKIDYYLLQNLILRS